jgi:HopA1 effector protein family
MAAGARLTSPPLAGWVREAVAGALAASTDAASIGDVEELADWLYGRWYCVLPPSEITPEPEIWPEPAELLRRAHAAATLWERGWVTVAVGPAGAVTAVREGRTCVRILPDYVNASRPGVPAAPGDALEVVARVDWTDPGGGWWYTSSSLDDAKDEPGLRLYVNAGLETAPRVVSELTRALGAQSARWSLKAPLEPADYRRRDSLVLFLQPAEWPRVRRAVRRALPALNEALRPSVPPLVKPLAPGLGLGEDPGGGVSFGQSRCLALAAALLELGRSGETGVTAVARRLAAYGVDPARPHLSPGRGLDYEL